MLYSWQNLYCIHPHQEHTCLSLTNWSNFFEVSSVLAKSSTPEVSRSSLWTVWSSEIPSSFPRMKITVLWRKRPQGWTGIDAGLSTTRTSPSSTRTSRRLPTTGGSCRCTVFFMWSLFCVELRKLLTFINIKTTNLCFKYNCCKCQIGLLQIYSYLILTTKIF